MLSLLLFAGAATAHFTLNIPTTIGFVDEQEATGPCGGFTPDFSTDTISDFYVGGSPIATTQLHSQGTWLYRAVAATDLPDNDAADWTQLFPLVQQSGLGKLCEPAVAAPTAWVGQQGILSIVVDAPDGVLYQCAAVRFVEGTAPSNDQCTNATGVDAAFVADSNLTPLAGGSSSSGSSSSNSSSTASSSGTATATSGSSTASSTASSTSSTATSSSSSTSAASVQSVSLLAGALAILAAVKML